MTILCKLFLYGGTRIGVFAQRQILCVSLHGLQAGHSDAPPPPPPPFG